MNTSVPPPFLTTLLSSYTSDPPQNRPHVTLTFAQSLDAKIGQTGHQLILSGKESMLMTHWMRSMHDAILIGIGTAINDNPQLNVRLLPPTSQPHTAPQPIILDTNLRLPPSCKLLQNFQSGSGRPPSLICQTVSSPEMVLRKHTLEAAGARILQVNVDPGCRLPLSSVLQALRSDGVKSLMVEGGAQLIESFLLQPSFVDNVVITVAPVLLGSGVAYHFASHNADFRHVHTELFGRDTVIALTS